MDNNTSNTNINISTQPPLTNTAPPPKKFSFSPKIIFIILGLVVLVEVILAVKTLLTPLGPAPANKSSASPTTAKTAGKISLTSSKTVFQTGEAVPVEVTVDTGGSTIAGADVLIKFDPKVLEASSDGLLRGRIFEEYPLLSVNSSQGLISISGINRSKNGFKGTGRFALINFKAKQAGIASLKIDFQKGSTVNSNLVEISTANNILDQVNNLEITIR